MTSTVKPAYIAYVMLVMLGFLMMTAAGSAGEYPINDDWVYALAVKSVLETGVYQFPSPASANVFPQIYWGALFCLPFGFSFEALRISTWVIGMAGVLVLFRTIETLTADWRMALAGALALLVNPLYFGLSNSYMTDVPFVACSIGALHFFIKGFRRGTDADLAIAIGVTLVVILIRQLGVSLLMGFAVAYVMRERFSARSIVKALVVIGVGVAVHVGYQQWLTLGGRTRAITVHSDLRKLAFHWEDLRVGLGMSWSMLLYLGLFILPLAALFTFRVPTASRPRRETWLAIGLAAFGVVLAVYLLSKNRPVPTMGNVLVPFGLGPLTLRDTYVLSSNLPPIPAWLSVAWTVVTVLSLAAVPVALYALAVRASGALQRFKKPEPRDLMFALLVGTALPYFLVMFYAVNRFAFFDRYLLFFLPLMILGMFSARAELLPAMRGARVAASVIVVLAFGLYSVLATHDHAAWARTHWQASEELVHKDSIDPKTIDGGYEFGWYIYHPAYVENVELHSWWWVVDDTWVVASGPLPGYREVRRYPYRRWLLGEMSEILVLRKVRP